MSGDVVARYRLTFKDLASKNMLGVAARAKRMSKSLRSASVSAARAATKVAAVGAALGGGAFMLANKVADRGDEFAKFSKQVGVSSEMLQKLEFVANRQGASFGKVKAGMQTFTKRMGELRSETGALYSGMEKLDPQFSKQLKATKTNEQAYTLMIKKVASLKTEQERAAFASAAFSKEAGVAVVRMAADGVNNVEELLKRASKIRPPLTKKQLKQSEAYSDSLYEAKSALASLADSAGGGLLSPLSKVLDKFTAFVIANRDLIRTNASKYFADLKRWVEKLDFDKIADGVGEFSVMLKDAFKAIKKGVKFIGGLENATIGLGSAFSLGSIAGFAPMIGALATPVGLAAVAIGAAAVLIYKYWEPLSGFFNWLGSVVADSILDIEYAARDLWTSLKTDTLSGIATIGGVILNWSPVGLFYKAFSGVMTYFGVTLPSSLSAHLKIMFSNLMTNIVNFSPIGGFYRAFAAVMTYFGVEMPLKLTDFMSSAFEKMKTEVLSWSPIDWFTEIFKGAFEWVSNKIDALVGTFTNIPTRINNAIKGIQKSLKVNVGPNHDGNKIAIRGKRNFSAAGEISDAAKYTAQIKSQSKLQLNQVVRVEGKIDGVTNMAANVSKSSYKSSGGDTGFNSTVMAG